MWVAAGAGALVLVAVLGITLLLHSERFHGYLLRTAQQKASDALGSRAQMRDFAVHWSGISPTVDLYGVVVHGAAPYSEPPLFEADAIYLRATITSWLHKAWYVSDVRIEHPIARIFAGRDGRTNLPPPKPTKSSAQNTMSVFDLGIRHLRLERGEFYYNNRKSEVSADLRDLALQSTFALITKSYSGTLSYREGRLQLRNANSIAHNFNARFVATPEEFKLETAVLNTAHSRLSLVADLHDYAQPRVHATYEAMIDAGEFRRALNNPSLPTGIIQSSGALDYDGSSSRSLLATVATRGEIRSTGMAVTGRSHRITLRNLGAQYSLVNGDAEITGISAQLLGGTLAGTMTIRDLAGSARSHLSVSLNALSLGDLQNALQSAGSSSSAANQIALRGSLNATADATWGKTMQNLLARADATLQAGVEPAKGGSTTALNGVIHTRYIGKSGQLAFDRSYLRTSTTMVTLNGTVGDKAALQVRVNSEDLHELEAIASSFRPPDSEPLGLYGRATMDASVSGSTRIPQLSGQLNAENLRLKGSQWKLLRANFEANPSHIRVENGELNSAGRGRVTFRLATALQQWSPTGSTPFQVNVAASQINVEDLAKAAGSTAPVAGTLSANIIASGTQLAATGHGTISLTAARVAGEPVRAVDLQFQGTGKQVNAKLKIDLPAGSTNATVAYEPASQTFTAELHAAGIKLDQLETVKGRNLQLQGILDVNAHGRGTVQNPQLQAVIEVPQLQVRDQVIRGIKLQSSVANHTANFTLDSEVINTHAGGHGTIELNGDYMVDASLDTQSIPLAPLAGIYVPSQAGNVTGETELHATLRGPLKDKTRLEAHVLIPHLAINYKDSIQVASEAPIRAEYSKGVLNLQRATIRGTGTEVTFQASLPTAKDAPASLLVKGNVDLRLAQLVSPDITSGGELQFDIDSSGHRSEPNVQGQIRIVNAKFATAGAPLGLQNGNGVLTLTRNRLDVTQFQGKVGGGSVTASGGLVYRPQLQFDLAMAAQEVRILYDQSVRTTLSSNMVLSGTIDKALLSGHVGIDQLSFTSDFEISDLMSQFGDATPPPAQGFSQNMSLDVGIETPGGLNLTSRTLSVAGSANLHLRGTAAQPVLLGRLNLSGGDLIFSGNRYKLQGGTIDFVNHSRTEPVVDMAVNTTIDQYEIQMHFWGPADHLHTNYVSDPALPPSDIINLIAFGKTSEAAAANPTPPGTLGAQSLIASQVSNQIANRVEKLAGISQLSIDPVLGSSQQTPGARVAIQQRITSKVFVTFATDVTSTERQVIKLEYQANRRTSFNAVRDQNGGFSFETTFRKQW
jgi:translocation and assembly module TamB